MVWKAAEEDSQHGRPALTEVIRRYWQPLYTFARRQGLSSEDAEDATQEFLSRVINGQLLENADPAKGRFRTFLLTIWKRFLIDEYRKAKSIRRGGAASVVSIDIDGGEQRWQSLQSREPDPDRVFLKTWAESLLDEAHNRLQRDYVSRGKADLLSALLPKLTQQLNADAYEAIAIDLNLTKGAVKVALHRLRQRFGDTLREVVAETVDSRSDIDSELADLLAVLSNRS